MRTVDDTVGGPRSASMMACRSSGPVSELNNVSLLGAVALHRS